MFAKKPADRRRSRRYWLNRMAKIQLGLGTLPRDCLVTDMSEGGVRLHVEGFAVPDEFVLLLSGEGLHAKERAYQVVWRLGCEIGAKVVGVIGRPDPAVRI
ncbi:MAG: PilZ domain-containing protein [Xanthobacteraceae bacterium]